MPRSWDRVCSQQHVCANLYIHHHLASPKLKGKIARSLATKTALSIRVDALSEEALDGSVGLAHRARVESRLMQLEGKAGVAINAAAVAVKPQMKKVEIAPPVKAKSFNVDSDIVLTAPATGTKRKAEETDDQKKGLEISNDADAAAIAEKAAKKARKEAKKAKKAKVTEE